VKEEKRFRVSKSKGGSLTTKGASYLKEFSWRAQV
jgi:hypothetical protein